jgi:DNA-binding beta-propeller fold protein YncE
LAFDGRKIWVINRNDNTVTAVGARDDEVFGTFRVFKGSWGIAFDGANIWTTSAAENLAVILSGKDGSFKRRLGIDVFPAAIICAGTSMWVACQNTVDKISPR